MAQATEQGVPVGGSRVQTGTRPRRRWRRGVVPWLFIAPILTLHLVVVIGPSIAAIYYSLTSWSGIGAAEFIGLENYRRLLFDDQSFRNALGNNLVWLAPPSRSPRCA